MRVLPYSEPWLDHHLLNVLVVPVVAVSLCFVGRDRLYEPLYALLAPGSGQVAHDSVEGRVPRQHGASHLLQAIQDDSLAIGGVANRN